MRMTTQQFWQLFAALLLTYLAGMFVNIMDVDASQYASMSREMLESGSYLQVYEHGRDYLDKPPLVFWLSSLSMWVFGGTNFAYKLPSFLFALLAIYSTYRFAKIFYSDRIAQLAALILASSQALFTITNDCRTDTLLMGCVIFSIWQLAEGFNSNNWRYFLGGFVGIGCGLLAKGLVAFIVPAMAFTAHFLYKKQFKNFFRLEFLWGLVVIAFLILPMCIGLYEQFDAHPEKLVNGKIGTSGLRFFFWIQSFGRITGENDWKNAVYFMFLFENMLWSFLPWILLFIAAYVVSVVNIFTKNRFFPTKELITLGGFTLSYISLASSKYQLPHYIFIVFPLISVMTAQFIVDILLEKTTKIMGKIAQILRGVQWFLISVLWALPFLILVYTLPNFGIPFVIMTIFALIYVILAIKYKQFIASSVFTTVVINLFLNIYFYPNLLTYQASSEMGKIVKDNKLSNADFFTYKYPALGGLHFYSQLVVQTKDSLPQIQSGNWLMTDENGFKELQNAPFNLEIVKKDNAFSVSALTPTFLNAKTRLNATEAYYLVKILDKK